MGVLWYPHIGLMWHQKAEAIKRREVERETLRTIA
jgi:hypothetical protein